VRLTQIKLSGFKSFVDPTSIHIPGKLVGIVGPNGCGKSNVIDAVRWVLGETRASALRGDSMQDVIFNGSRDRKPLARASVELNFDNSLGRAAGQWSQYAELSVKRILQRDGESSYYINGTHVRRRDITDMFLGTGLGPRAYAIIEQGMISRVIEAKPDELRVFLEEAAGISKYKERRKETERRLQDTRENLARVTDIRLELGTQIEKLEGQAKIASQYQELQQEVQLKQHLLWFLRRKDAAGERDRHGQEITRTGIAQEAETAKLREVEGRLESARAEHYGAGDALNAAQAEVYAANSEVAKHESELRHVEETRQRLESQHTERRAQLTAWREQRSQLTQSMHSWVARSAQAREAAVKAQARRDAESALLPQAEQAWRVAQEQQAEARAAVTQADGAHQLEQQGLAHLDRSLQSLAQRRERLEAELRALVAPDAGALAAADARSAALKQAIAEAQAALDREQAQAAGVESKRADAVREHTSAAAQLATLKQVQAQADENVPLQEWLERHAMASLPRFWQKVRIDHGWETAVEAVLRERLHALEIGESAAMAAIGQEPPPVKASVFARGASAAPAPASSQPTLASKVHATDPALAGAIRDWLGGALAIEGKPDAALLGALPDGAFYVNREGHQYTRHTLSYHAPDPADAGILARQAEIDELEVRVRQLEEAAAAASAAAARQDEALESARERIAAGERELHAVQIESLTLGQALERHRERAGQIRKELEEIGQESTRDSERLAAARDTLVKLEAGMREARAALERVGAAHVAAESALAAQRQRVQQTEREALDAIFAERESASKVTEIDGSVKLIDQQIERADEEIARLTKDLAVDPVPAVREALDLAIEVRIGCEKKLASARDAVEVAAGALRTLEEERLRIESGIAPLRERIGELRLKEQAARLSFEQYDGQLREASADEERLTAAVEGAPRPSTLQAEITRATQAMNELGAVNLAALEELSTSRERKQFLDAQSADLEEASTTLEDAIRRIDRETRELLRETFEAVNKHFGAMFPALFGGGEARLTMTGEEILDAGVLVTAQPPGKRNTSIHLLSGGEKALTALALVFSMFQLNPAPFCLLDEVDAPLDDSNAQRFCDLVSRMSAQTQFLFISHNKITMEMAGQLIGVTMPESGVSRVVEVDIAEALRIREELAA
jgi:chromosome segregation protein